MIDNVTKTESGWPAHFCCGNRCVYHRNTLLEWHDIRIIVSTVGSFMPDPGRSDEIDHIGYSDGKKKFYETMVFEAIFINPYWEINVTKPIYPNAQVAIAATSAKDLPREVDNLADQMHETVVQEICEAMQNGTLQYMDH